MNEFAERYKHLNNLELLRIIENATQYQTEAIEAAKFVLDSRQLSLEDLQSLKDTLAQEMLHEKERKQRTVAIQHQAKNAVFSFFEKIIPVQRQSTFTDKIIHLITIVYGTYILYLGFVNAQILNYLFGNSFEMTDLEFLLMLIPFVFLLPALVLFFMKKNIGWVMLLCYLLYSSQGVIVHFYKSVNDESGIYNPSFFANFTLFIALCVHVASLLFLYQPETRKVFKIDINTAVFVSGLTLALLALNLYKQYGV